jgi:outer membrane protein OmpA-like peptidoglycan-associated protein
MLTAGTPVLALLLVLGAGGCATKKQVAKSFADVERSMQDLESSIEENQTRIATSEQVIRDHDGRIIEVSDETKTALARIEEVEQLAMGKLLFEVVLNNDAVKFDFDTAELTPEGQEAIKSLVNRLIIEDRNVFIEIQGHTDSTGSEEHNYELGLKRAEAVRRHLSLQGLPLHRMSVISYGESEPVADNNTREGRRENRRVVLLVLE